MEGNVKHVISFNIFVSNKFGPKLKLKFEHFSHFKSWVTVIKAEVKSGFKIDFLFITFMWEREAAQQTQDVESMFV